MASVATTSSVAKMTQMVTQLKALRTGKGGRGGHCKKFAFAYTVEVAFSDSSVQNLILPNTRLDGVF